MTIRFACSECGSVLKIKDELAGTPARCPKCKTKFVVPAAPAAEQPSGESEEAANHHSDPDALSGESAEHHAEPTSDRSSPAETPTNPVQQAESEPSPVASFISSDAKSESNESKSVASTSKLTAELSESPTVATGPAPLSLGDDAPLSLDDSDDEVDAVATQHQANGEGIVAPIDSSSTEDDDDLDSPSVFVSSIVPLKSPDESSPKKPDRRRSSSDATLKEPAAESSKRDEPFDPMKYLMAEPPAKSRHAFPEPTMDDSDLSLSDDALDEPVGRPTPQPLNRPTPASMNTRATPDKVDLATAARMMKKAIKDSQNEAAHQRELEAQAGYDYLLFFREFGARGFAILGGGLFLFILCLFLGNYIFGSKVNLPKMGYVRGTVTLDGQPLAGALVMYEPINVEMKGRDRARTSIGVTDEKGHFKMMYRPAERIEGVAIGKCHVWVSHIGPKGEDVPPDFLFQKGIMVEVTPGYQKEPADLMMISRPDAKKK